MTSATSSLRPPSTDGDALLRAAQGRTRPALQQAVQRRDPRTRHIAGHHRGWRDADGTPDGAAGSGRALRPAAWRVFGTADALLTGDALLNLATEVLLDVGTAVRRHHDRAVAALRRAALDPSTATALVALSSRLTSRVR